MKILHTLTFSFILIAVQLSFISYSVAGVGGKESQSRRRMQEMDDNVKDIKGELKCVLDPNNNTGAPCELTIRDTRTKKNYTLTDNDTTSELRGHFQNDGHRFARVKGTLLRNDRTRMKPYKIVESKK